MKLTLAFIFALNMTVLASFGQRITLSENQSSLNNVLKKIKNQTSYDFMISSSLLQLARPVSITVSNAHIEDVLQRLFENQPLEYEIVKNAVLVTRKKEVKENSIAVSNVNNQQRIIGRVVDQHDKGVAGVTVVVKGEANAVTSDAQGYFILPASAIRQTIQITSVGYNRHEVVAMDKMVVRLTAKSNEIDEVVSVGYGTTKRKDLTGSVASVNVDEIKNTPFISIDQALAGKAAGVQVVQADGSPGGVAKIRIRGGASLIGGNDPLYIIDGIQVPIQNRYVQAAADLVNPGTATKNERLFLCC
ncbi:STN domain-containing protein [Sphingobacterium nematocida]|nr:STN domain-containing protein [Sphingobacterium nematocida]